MPYETISEYSIYVNSEAIANLGITVPDEVAEVAIEASEVE